MAPLVVREIGVEKAREYVRGLRENDIAVFLDSDEIDGFDGPAEE